MDFRLDEMTDRELEELNDAFTLIITAKRIAQRHGLDKLNDVQLSMVYLDMIEEESRRNKSTVLLSEVYGE